MVDWMGIKFIENPLLPDSMPRFRLAAGDYIGPEFRASMDAWCDEFFGRYTPILFVDPGTAMVGPCVVAMIRAECPLQGTENG